MCGRFTLTVSARVLAELFDVPEIAEFAPRYNIAPTQQVLVVRAGDDGGGTEVVPIRWGLVPSWAKDLSIGSRMINARGETVASKPAFRSAVKHRRCLIPADGFFEWKKLGTTKQPYLIRFADKRPLAFAGLWERWRQPDSEPVDSCTIITTSPNDLLAEIHDRMPVILPPDQHGEWLAPSRLPNERLSELLVPHPPDEMEAFPVSTHVNRPANDDPACIEPLDQPSLFQ